MQEIKGDLVSKVLPSYDISPDAATWASDAIEYNVPGVLRVLASYRF